MKKEYTSPVAVIINVSTAQPLNTSGVYEKEGRIDYGGVDTEGTVIPNARRRRRNVWDEGEEEENW